MGYAEQKLQHREQVLADEGEDILLSLDGTTELSRKALVRRGTPQPIGETPNVFRRVLTVVLANDATLGALASEIVMGRFYLVVAPKIGGTAETLRSAQIVAQDAAWVVLEAQ